MTFEEEVQHLHQYLNSKIEHRDDFGFTLIRLCVLMNEQYITNFNKKLELFYGSVLLEIIVHLSDLLQKLKRIDPTKAILFTDDITPYYGIGKANKYENITDLITFFRNAGCHIGSSKRYAQDGKAHAWSVQVGNNPILEYPTVGKYSDDAIVIMGNHRLYIKRHIVRSFKEMLSAYRSLPDFFIYKTIIDVLPNL